MVYIYCVGSSLLVLAEWASSKAPDGGTGKNKVPRFFV